MSKNKSKPIELFPNSKLELEDLTGETFEAMKKDGQLVVVNSVILNPQGNELPRGISSAKEQLRENARKIGADALVYVNYYFPNPSNRNSETYAEGYALKRTSK